MFKGAAFSSHMKDQHQVAAMAGQPNRAFYAASRGRASLGCFKSEVASAQQIWLAATRQIHSADVIT